MIKPLKSFFRSITSNKSNAVAAVLLLAVFLVIVPADFTYADEPKTTGQTIAGWAAKGIAALMYDTVISFLVWILAIVGTLANHMIQPIQIITSNTVQMGWGITRDFANMFFILILLGIALDYILMGVSFGVKKALPTFIAVALLINFSLPIAGVFIDFANVFTSFFLEQIGGTQFSEYFGNLIGVQTTFDGKTLTKDLNQFTVGTAVLTDTIFAIFFLIGTIFILLALSFMFLVRTGFLMGLLVVLPLVLVIMPFNKSYWGKWSGMFLKYVMFAPAATFFLYLSMKIFEGNILSNLGASSLNIKAGNEGFIDQVVQYLVIWFFMGGSLVAANSFGVYGSGAALKMFNTGENWVKGKIRSGAVRAGRRGWRETGGRVAGAVSEAINRGTEGKGRIVSTIGGLVSRPLQRIGVASRAGVEATRDAAVRARYKNFNPQERRDTIRSLTASGMNNGALATLVTMQMEQGEETGLTTSQLRTIYDSHVVSGQQRARLRRGSPALALQVLAVPPGPAPAAGTPARAAYDQAVRERRNYVNGLRSSDIEKIPRDELAQPGAGGIGTVMRDIVREMITGGDWSDNKFKALNDVDPALFLGEFDAYLGTIPKATRGPVVPPATRGGITAAPPNHGIGTDQNYLKLARYLESTAGQGLTTVTL